MRPIFSFWPLRTESTKPKATDMVNFLVRKIRPADFIRAVSVP